MPRARKQPNDKQKADVNKGRRYFAPPDAEWGGYINVRVDASERADFDGWQVAEQANISRMLEDAAIEGLKLSVSYDAANSAYVASFTGAGCLADDARYVLSARSGDFWEAVALLLYKHHVLLRGDWGAYMPSSQRASFG